MMEHLSSKNVSWLLNKESKNKASLLHRIKRLECDLIAVTQVSSGMQPEACLEITEKLLEAYRLYLKFFQPIDLPPLQMLNEFICAEQVYEKITQLQQQMTLSTLDIDRATVIRQLVGLYELFKSYLLNNKMGQKSSPIKGKPLQRLLQIRQPDQWILCLIQWLNRYQENSLGQLSNAFQDFDMAELRCWEYVFSEPSFLKLFNSIYYYKLFPEKLFLETIHSEKLISISQRLTWVYHFIEQIQQLYYKQADALQLDSVNDLLLHETELPEGVELHVDESLRPTIHRALKEWRVFIDALDEEALIQEHLFDLLRSYKFWFNPERLVDALMVLQKKLSGQCITESFDRQQFKQAMLQHFQSFKTSDCLDLYGYFSNKDSRYLLRLIHHLLHGGEVNGIIISQQIERQALLRVFESFYSAMEALRETLQQREIGTKPYSLDLERPFGQPGRRKCRAVQRIISLYAIEPVTKNASLEELFEQGETH